MSRRRPREVEIFNFSFLDILACTIGLLIFIMVMVFVLQSGSAVADISKILAHRAEQTHTADQAAARDDQISSILEQQLSAIPSRVSDDLLKSRQDAQAAVNAAQDRLKQQNAALNAAEADIATARSGQAASQQEQAQVQSDLAAAEKRLADAQSAVAAAKDMPGPHLIAVSAHDQGNSSDSNYQILHVDCHDHEVILLVAGDNGILREIGRTDAGSLDDSDSAFATAVAKQKDLPHPLVLFWVRPDGMKTYNTAAKALPDDMPHGYEPADADWEFTSK